MSDPVSLPGTTPFKPGVLEILSRSGQVLQRIHYNGEEVRVGRAYDNDLIIGDPFVCPHHLVIRAEQGQLILEDLGSINGTWIRKGKVRLARAEVQQGDLVQLGHSQLRFRSIDSDVAPAWRDTARHGLLSLLGRRWMLPVAVVLCVLTLALDKLIDSSRELAPAILASQLFYPLVGVMLWSGFWAMLNRLIAHRANFCIHLSIAALAVAALFFNGQGVPLLGFAFDLSSMVGWLRAVGQILILGLALIAHLKFATHGRTWVQATGSAVLAAMLIGIPQYGDLSGTTEFSSLPRLSPLLKPPSAKLVKGDSVEDFVQRAGSLRQALDQGAAD